MFGAAAAAALTGTVSSTWRVVRRRGDERDHGRPCYVWLTCIRHLVARRLWAHAHCHRGPTMDTPCGLQVAAMAMHTTSPTLRTGGARNYTSLPRARLRTRVRIRSTKDAVLRRSTTYYVQFRTQDKPRFPASWRQISIEVKAEGGAAGPLGRNDALNPEFW